MPNTSETTQQVIALLGDVLALDGSRLHAESPLLGSLPELDSMAVLNVITALEEHFGISVQDDEISAAVFDSVATLSAFVGRQLGA
ncbi:MAG: acyl carrier protein [Pseudomonadota bacterium]